MTDETDPTTDPTVDPTPDPTPTVDDPPFVPTLQVTQQGSYRSIVQQRAPGAIDTIILEPDEAKSVAWALLTPDDATQDATSGIVTPGASGRFT